MPILTQKVFTFVAAVLKDLHTKNILDRGTTYTVADAFALRFTDTNPKFKRELFLAVVFPDKEYLG